MSNSPIRFNIPEMIEEFAHNVTRFDGAVRPNIRQTLVERGQLAERVVLQNVGIGKWKQ